MVVEGQTLPQAPPSLPLEPLWGGWRGMGSELGVQEKVAQEVL